MMKVPRKSLRISSLATAIATTIALSGCFVQSPKPESDQAGQATPAPGQDATQNSSDEPNDIVAGQTDTSADKDQPAAEDQADITLTVTPESSAEAATSEAQTKQASAEPAPVEDTAIELPSQEQPEAEPTDIEQQITRKTPPDGTTDANQTVATDIAADEKKIDSEPAAEAPTNTAILYLCDEIGNKLGSVSVEDCLNVELADTGARSRLDRSLAVKEYFHSGEEKTGRVLLMGGIHGDEFSSVSVIFKWLKFIEQDQATEFTWQVVPLLNPDGLLRKKSQRQNDAGVDLNRNFPSPDWEADAHRYWTHRTGSNPRRYPGPDAASEPETQWFINTIETFNPDAIVAVHAPHSLVDYDGPQQPPTRLGKLRLHELGIYPGSLGNYAGVYKNIPVVTIELPSAGIMPTRQDINQMWLDLVQWLHREVPKQKLARLEKEEKPKSDELPEIDSLH